MRTIVLNGRIQAITPLFFSIFSNDGPVAKVVNDNGEIEDRVIISANSLRGGLRHKCAEYFLRKYYEKTNKKIDYLTYILYTGGGIITKKDTNSIIIPEKFVELRRLLDKTLILSLFGATLPYPVHMIEGKIRVGYAISKLEKKDLDTLSFSKSTREAEFFKAIAESIAEEKYYIETFKNIREKEEKEGKKDKEGEFQMIRKKIDDLKVIPKGTRFEHLIEIVNATDEELALVLLGLKILSLEGIGGMKRLAFGKIAFDYDIFDTSNNTRTRVEIKNGEIKVDDTKGKEWIEECFKKLEDHFENIKDSEWACFSFDGIKEAINSVSKVLEGKKKSKEKKEEEKGDTTEE